MTKQNLVEERQRDKSGNRDDKFSRRETKGGKPGNHDEARSGGKRNKPGKQNERNKPGNQVEKKSNRRKIKRFFLLNMLWSRHVKPSPAKGEKSERSGIKDVKVCTN